MLQFLDGMSNRRGAVNENYARELMELFTLGAVPTRPETGYGYIVPGAPLDDSARNVARFQEKRGEQLGRERDQLLLGSVVDVALDPAPFLVGLTGGTTAEFNLGIALSKRLTIRGTVLRARSIDEKASATKAFADFALPLIEKGTIRATVVSS